MPGILTRSGVLVDVIHPNPDDILIEDIAFSLSNQCRYNGHVPFYSVAEHSILASFLVSKEHALCALLHDASEAYLCDIPRPIKYLLAGYKTLEVTLESVIARKFGFQFPYPNEVKAVDNGLLLLERTHLLPMQEDGTWAGDWPSLEECAIVNAPISRLDPDTAYAIFMDRFKELTDAVDRNIR